MQIRINAYDRAPHENMTLSNQLKFYNYYPRLIKMSKEDSLMKKISLQPGTVLLVNNWRILHGRTAFEGQRTLSGCYIKSNFPLINPTDTKNCPKINRGSLFLLLIWSSPVNHLTW